MAMQAPAPKKAWFLYLMTELRICRLNIDKFCKRNSPKPRGFELVHDYHDDDDKYIPKPIIPMGMRPIVVDSKVYLLGGETRRTRTCDPESKDSGDDDDSGDGEINNSGDDYRRDRKLVRRLDNSTVPNLDAFAFDPDASEGATISLSDGRTIPRRIIDPRLVGRNTLFGPIVFTLENKIYVIARVTCSVGEKDIDHQPPLFKVFDPLHQFWKQLPRPPQCDDHSSLHQHCTWAHNIVIGYWRRGVYLFDTRREKWEHWPEEQNDRPVVFRAVVEFEGFLIGVIYSENTYWINELAVYQLDANGIPKLIRALDELQGIFCPFLRVMDCFMGKCDGGRIWLVVSCEHGYERVAVFQVFISDDLDGNPVLTTELEAAEFYQFGDYKKRSTYTYSGFSMYHNTNNRGIEEENLCGTIKPHDHPRG